MTDLEKLPEIYQKISNNIDQLISVRQQVPITLVKPKPVLKKTDKKTDKGTKRVIQRRGRKTARGGGKKGSGKIKLTGQAKKDWEIQRILFRLPEFIIFKCDNRGEYINDPSKIKKKCTIISAPHLTTKIQQSPPPPKLKKMIRNRSLSRKKRQSSTFSELPKRRRSR